MVSPPSVLNMLTNGSTKGRPQKKRVNLGTLTLKGGRGQKKNQKFSLLEKGKMT